MSRSYFIGILVCLLFSGKLAAQDKYYGPFASWADVKKRFNAKGDGKTDDSRALQQAIDGLSNLQRGSQTRPDTYTVIYLPPGTYNISKTLVLRGKIGVSIIGEDPANTIIRWTGPDADTMLWANGSAYFKIARLTWDAGNRKNLECIGIHWKEKWRDEFSQSYASLNIELSDMLFTGNPMFGISGGTLGGPNEGTGANDSEISIKRCSFYNCVQAGIRIAGYNALDYWIWDAKFINCYIGVWNSFGNYHIYRSLFRGSKFSDIHNKSGYYTSVRYCYSEGARTFSDDEGSGCNPFKRILQGNTIVKTAEIPLEYYHLGCLTLIDNQIGVSSSKQYPMLVNQKTWCTDRIRMLTVGNRYGNSAAIRLASPKQRLLQAADQTGEVGSTGAAAFDQRMPRTPARTPATIFEVPRDATTEAIQKIINDAAAVRNTNAVVHFGTGIYKITKPLVVPAGAGICLAGDGLLYASEIIPSDPQLFSGKFLLEINGPSTVSLRDLQLGADGGSANTASAILFRNIDQKGSALIADQLYIAADTSLLAKDLNNIYIEKNNSFFSAGNVLIGGKQQAAGTGTFRVNCFGGQFARLSVQNKADFLARDCWWEGPDRTPLLLFGDGNITIDGAMIAPNHSDSSTAVKVNRFNGKIALMNMYIQGCLDVSPGNPNLRFLGWNLHFYHKLDPLFFLRAQGSYQGLFSGISTQNFDKAIPIDNNPFFVEDQQLNVKADKEQDFILDMLAQDRREKPLMVLPTVKNASAVSLSRVSLGFLKKGITILNQ